MSRSTLVMPWDWGLYVHCTLCNTDYIWGKPTERICPQTLWVWENLSNSRLISESPDQAPPDCYLRRFKGWRLNSGAPGSFRGHGALVPLRSAAHDPKSFNLAHLMSRVNQYQRCYLAWEVICYEYKNLRRNIKHMKWKRLKLLRFSMGKAGTLLLSMLTLTPKRKLSFSMLNLRSFSICHF